MLMKFWIAFASLAASVVSSPAITAEISQSVNLEECQTVIVQVKQPVVQSCSAGQVDQVKGHLQSVAKPVKTVAVLFHASLVIRQKIQVTYSSIFIKVLVKFQEILKVISNYPKIAAGCTDVFLELDYHFDSICTDFKKGGVDIYQLIQKETSIDVSVWVKLGFTFHSKSSTTIGSN